MSIYQRIKNISERICTGLAKLIESDVSESELVQRMQEDPLTAVTYKKYELWGRGLREQYLGKK